MGLTYEQILKVWREADQIPVFEHAWLWDHIVPLRGGHQCRRPRGVDSPRRTGRPNAPLATRRHRDQQSPAFTDLAAKMAATVDIVSGGRLDFGIGVGGSRLAVENPAVREFEAYGVPLVSPGVTVRDFADSCTIIHRIWTETEPFDFDGQSIHLRGAVCEPKPLQKPIRRC
jgi:hypothetical protein